MTTSSCQLGTEELSKRLDIVESDLLSRKEIESTLGMGISYASPVKISHVDGKGNMEVNMLKISVLNNEMMDNASTNMQAEGEKGSDNKSDRRDSLSIL